MQIEMTRRVDALLGPVFQRVDAMIERVNTDFGEKLNDLLAAT